MIINDSKQHELLGDIAKLIKKYGKETFSELAILLKDPNLVNQIAETLEKIVLVSPQKKSNQKRPSPLEVSVRFRESLTALGKTDPEKSKLLLLMFDSLQDKTILPSLRELTDFISDHGLPVPKTKSRDKAIFSFLRKCTELTLKELDTFNAALIPHQQHSKDGDRSLEGWGKIILDHKNR